MIDLALAHDNGTPDDGDAAIHPFLSGIQAPMREEIALADLPVTGSVPAALKGRYLRIGPNPINPDPAGYHWFSGDGMVHGVMLTGGKKAEYENRWVRSNHVSAALGEQPAPGPRSYTDNVNTSVHSIGGKVWALVEAGGYPVELGASLKDQAHNNFDGTLHGAFTAHPIHDPATGEHHAVTYSSRDPGNVTHVVVSREGHVVRELKIPVAGIPSVHTCALTKQYVVVLDLNVRLSMEAAQKGFSFPFTWDTDHAARVGLLPRTWNANDVIWCPVDPSYIFHVGNAYEAEDGRVVMDVIAYDKVFWTGELGLSGPDATGQLERWTVDPKTQNVERRVLDASPQEFPIVDPRLSTQPHRYLYSPSVAAGTRQFTGGTQLYKHDVQGGERQVHDFGANRFPGEFSFVPASAQSAEDEGWLIGLVVDSVRNKTDLVILEAQNFAAPPVAIVHLPHRVPPGFHGNWFAG